MKKTIILLGQPQRALAIEAIRNAPDDYVVTISPRNRTHEQNSLLWAVLQCISEQVMPDGKFYAPETWLEYFKQRFLGTEMLELPNGKLREVEIRSSRMDKKAFSDFVEQIMAWASERKVKI